MVSSNPDELRTGHETKSWKERSVEQRKTVKAITLILTFCLSAYMPVSRMSFELIFCNEMYRESLPGILFGLVFLVKLIVFGNKIGSCSWL